MWQGGKRSLYPAASKEITLSVQSPMGNMVQRQVCVET